MFKILFKTSFFLSVSLTVFGQPLSLPKHEVDELKLKLTVYAEDTNRVINLWRLARYHTMTAPRQAVIYANESISLARKLNFTYGELVSLQALSFVTTITGDWQEGMRTAYEGLKISQEKYPKLEIVFYNLIALVYEKQNDSKQRLEWLLKAKNDPEIEYLPNHGKWLIYHNLGEVYENLNDFENAMYYGKIINKACRKLNIPIEVSYANAIMGRVENKRKNYAEALKYLKIATHFSNKFGNPFLESEQSVDLASVFHAINQPDSAVYYAEKALSGGREFKNLVLTAASAKLLAQIYEKSNPSKSITYLKIFNAANDSLYTASRIIQTQNIVKAEEQRKRDLLEARKDYDNSIRQNSLIGFLIFLGILAIILIQNNRQKNKANAVLQSKNVEISRQKEEIEKAIEQKQVLLSELQHRVKNNLQYVISILEIQKESIDYSNIDDLIRNNQNRIHSIAMLHKKLSINDSVNDVNLNQYVNDLSELVKESYDNKSKNVSMFITCEIETLHLSKALPLGLIIVELVSNSMKHAFKNQPNGIISIEIIPDENSEKNLLNYIDNGEGFDFNNVKTKGLGVEIMKGLIDQLNGIIETQSKRGFELKIYF
ncbi:MAG: sensor histidine kinase [Cytophagaceae bacterium]|nr:sensor histidine kinase [Cytophagaceae bacterium]MBK9934279.1 sensor histidine kinase [Cytophagaceae bacterium]MBL0300730.1 sensor histidine kinase [Cytophagaceae bacterium]MBL0327672.1 sensor histidine kinase [Cytophagaceae bacterium]